MQAFRVLGDTRKALLVKQAQVWESTAHLNVTERREECRYAVVDYAGMVVEQEAEIDALKVELNHIELEMTHGGA